MKCYIILKRWVSVTRTGKKELGKGNRKPGYPSQAYSLVLFINFKYMLIKTIFEHFLQEKNGYQKQMILQEWSYSFNNICSGI